VVKQRHIRTQTVVRLRRVNLVPNGKTTWLRAFPESCSAKHPQWAAMAIITDVVKIAAPHHWICPSQRGLLPGSV
jgi:hypothetical protein